MIEIQLRRAITLYEKRTGKRMTYEHLSQKTGLSLATIQSIATRPGYNATLSTINLLCQALLCKVDEILFLEEHAN